MASLTLEPFAERHVAALAPMIIDPDVLRFTRIPDPPPADFARQWLERYEIGRAEGTRDSFAAVGEDGELLGMGMAPTIDLVAQEAELGYLVAPQARGRGLGTEILRRLTRWAFDEAGLLRVTLLIDVDNGPSLVVAQRCGYVQEGLMRSVFHKPGAPRVDLTLWARLADG
ncbi:MAG: GNAT family N-acetyltransferase [Solirubrobacteraceae bacterium]